MATLAAVAAGPMASFLEGMVVTRGPNTAVRLVARSRLSQAIREQKTMKEKLQEYALIAEIISAVAIVLSLVFVGLQVRQGNEATAANTQAIRSQVLQTLMNAELNILSNAIEYPYLIGVRYTPEEDSDPTESLRASAYFFTMQGGLRRDPNVGARRRAGRTDDIVSAGGGRPASTLAAC